MVAQELQPHNVSAKTKLLSEVSHVPDYHRLSHRLVHRRPWPNAMVGVNDPRGPSTTDVNFRTIIVDFSAVPGPGDYQQFFRTHWSGIRDVASAANENGLVIYALNRFSFCSVGTVLQAIPGSLTVLNIGRHSMADLCVKDDRAFSLRHLAVLVHWPNQQSSPSNYRVLDLNTEAGTTTEFGEDLHYAITNGPLLFQVSDYLFFCHWAADLLALPDDADAAWLELPKRSYREGKPTAGVWDRRQPSLPRSLDARNTGGRRDSAIFTLPGPAELARVAAGQMDRQLAGTLDISSNADVVRLRLSTSQLDGGVLIGRYNRCDVGAIGPLADEWISRVHALLIQIEGELYLVDTASTIGVFNFADERVSVALMSEGDGSWLGEALVKVVWCRTN